MSWLKTELDKAIMGTTYADAYDAAVTLYSFTRWANETQQPGAKITLCRPTRSDAPNSPKEEA